MGKSERKGTPGQPRRSWRIILKMIFKKWLGNMECIDVDQDRDKCRALGNAVTNFWVP